MRYIILTLLLTGCASTTVPVTVPFPQAPQVLMQRCPPLKLMPEDAKLSDVARIITENYTLYYNCAIKNDAWIEWFDKQKQIYGDF